MICNEKGELRKLTLEDLTLQVCTRAGDYVAKDTTCDTEFMLDIIDDLGAAIRKVFHWVHKDHIIHLFMDNLGDH